MTKPLLIFLALGLTSCASYQRAESDANDLARLTEMMTGTFDSSAQAAADEDFFNIRLVMLPVWEERSDGPWLYVEQAVAAAADRPYRQRVYRLVDLGDGNLRSDVYTLPGDALDFTAAWRTGALDAITPELLDEREGCSIHLTLQPNGSFTGATKESDCVSSLRGAAYATSEVTITNNQLVSWDRGWDSKDEQVWGAVTAGYVFVKQSDGAPDE